jgi:branched-chain amino acid aminotransferase
MAAEHVAWLNGRFVPLTEASLSIFDAGVTRGATVTERLRTFRHEPFLLDEHLTRLGASAQASYVPLAASLGEIQDIVRDVIGQNAAVISAEDDLAVSIFATPGTEAGPTLCVTATPITARQYADTYETGLRLVTPATQSMPAETVAPQIKTRSRLHWHIADCQAAQQEPAAKALLIDQNGFVTETATGNLFVSFHGGRRIATPRRTRTLCGISQAFVLKMLPGVAEEADLRPDNVTAADEAFVTSSVSCILPVVSLNGWGIGEGRPGLVYRRLLAAWSEAVGVDIAGQMRRMAAK